MKILYFSLFVTQLIKYYISLLILKPTKCKLDDRARNHGQGSLENYSEEDPRGKVGLEGDWEAGPKADQ